jgi:hypothetical protein
MGLQRFSVSVALEDDISGMLCSYGLSTPDRNCSANIALFLRLHGHQIICIRLWGLLLKTFVETTWWLMAEYDHKTHLLHGSRDVLGLACCRAVASIGSPG